MDAEQKRPLAAFVVVSATGALLLGQSLHSQTVPSAADRAAASRASSEATTSSSPSGSPANGQAVHGITAPPTYLPVKSIGRAPLLMARGDDGLGISTGAVSDPEGKPSSPTDGVRTRDKDDSSPGPQGTGPSVTPEPNPTEGPGQGFDDDTPGNSDGHSQGPKVTPPHWPFDDGTLPTPQGPNAHGTASASATGSR